MPDTKQEPVETDWQIEYQKKSECYNELKAEYVRLLCEYHNFKDTFRALAAKRGATENRERKLKAAITIAANEYEQWQDKAAAANVMLVILSEALKEVYGQERGEDDAGSDTGIQGHQEGTYSQEG
ncbi:hypothetical protein [Paenibacillus dendritiformis]|uniref:hypothetical protein n=1 Tax=Paenibacillus dendritiformis TaxID=130049 RepID=UPI000DA96BA8|nr:hypothetical protein [Paenibacillus dendritiformis]PZM63484.1 hypothetical protein DOE73_21845 [Paenibacillus dendritiformis]